MEYFFEHAKDLKMKRMEGLDPKITEVDFFFFYVMDPMEYKRIDYLYNGLLLNNSERAILLIVQKTEALFYRWILFWGIFTLK